MLRWIYDGGYLRREMFDGRRKLEGNGTEGDGRV
jgi:hypothetical protein